jgi:hypothetical protein
MCRFIAIPVSQGDAFFLEITEGSVLVDGGRSISGFPALFKTWTKRNGVDILVATHNDADHANGILGFLDRGLCCRELWLPARWARVLPNALRPWEEVVYLLVDQVHRVRYNFKSGASLLEQYADSVGAEPQETEDAEPLELDSSGWALAWMEELEDAAEGYDLLGIHWWEYGILLKGLFPPYNPKLQLLLEAIVAAKRIREIALKAYHRGIPVRWFEFDTSKPGGGCGWLEPINGRLIHRVIPAPQAQFLEAVALTVFNKESLVLSGSPTSLGASVLFTADSDLTCLRFSVTAGDIVTAPHHGSAANKSVYSLINAPVIWVRSDGRAAKRPCPEYLQARGRRYCTLCRGTPNLKQAVTFWRRSGRWVRGKGVRICACC